MGVIGEQLGVTGVLALGDNFYFDGVQTNATSHRFEDTWNSVYPHDALQVPWYLLGGNVCLIFLSYCNCYASTNLMALGSMTTTETSPLSWNIPSTRIGGTFLRFTTPSLSLTRLTEQRLMLFSSTLWICQETLWGMRATLDTMPSSLSEL